MRAIRVASAALLGAGALAFTAPTAAAGDSNAFGFSVMPSTIAAGGQVTLSVDRGNGNCGGTVIVSSGVFDTVRIPPDRSQSTATVDWDARPGAAYRVTFTCNGGDSGTAQLTIAGGRGPTQQPYPLYPPNRGVHAGEGGTVGGFDLKELGLGTLLIVGSVGAAYHFSRRRTGEDGT
ncbi:hypothetical protein [Streptomyces niveiscabiei]|uniref:Lipoprotein n=1 Tax=Streptomyces niveiscabiei TaxID=164115 RepID=A0ABW9HUV8_9ACTN|nr:hypothetical protein [Streptomyces niveiscabiei]MDX3380527.1 hypothetical protein [Streptomyces niveiscabiei]